jgi:FkbM family methyltransferase
MASLLASSHYSRKNGWTISCAGSRISLENAIDFLTIYDFFVDRHYAPLEQRASFGSVLWDIGANLGAVSLMFARNPRIAHVYAYEPMPETFAYAVKSLALNPDISGKITLKKAGVSGNSGTQRIAYTRKVKCAIGTSEIPPRLISLGRVQASDFKEIDIELVDAVQELQAIRKKHLDSPIALKLDAEGAEYAIIERLKLAGMLSEIQCAAIEWHGRPGPDFLLNHLYSAGFKANHQVLEADGAIGMINAWREA